MSYVTSRIELRRFQAWLYFALGDIIGNAGIITITSADIMDKLKALWPNAKIVPELAYVGIIFALISALLVILFKTQFFIEVLQTADFAAILFAFYSFSPSIFKLPAGVIIFWIITLLFIVGYIASQWRFTETIKRQGTISDKVFFAIIFFASIIIFLAPAIVLNLN